MDNGRSLAELRLTTPDEDLGRIEYTNKHIWIGGFRTLEILDWAAEVGEAVRKQAEADGAPIPGIDQPLDEYFPNQELPD